MEEVEERLLRAVDNLTVLRDERAEAGKRDQYQWTEYIRICGKIEGIKLALYYLEDEKSNK